jgi:DNA polymerase-3 subunit delta
MSAVHLVTAGDNADVRLVADKVRALVHQCLGDGDRSLMLEEFDGDDYTLAAVVDAAQTLPFLTDRRVVVARGVGRFAGEESAGDVATLVAYLRSPSDTTDLVLVGGGGRIPKAITDAVKAVGTVHTVSGPRSTGDKQAFVNEALEAAGLTLRDDATALVVHHLGEEVAALGPLLETLASIYGSSRKLTVGDVAPYLGDAGGVPPWDLTDAIDAGDVPRALGALDRMLGTRHPLVVMAILTSHYQRMLRLDGARVTDDASAAVALGLKPSQGRQARRALDGARRLGHDGVVRAFALLAEADSGLRGGSGWPERAVVEVLVARLARSVRPAARSRPAAAGRGGVRPR